VTAPGGGPCSGPRRPFRRNRGEPHGDVPSNGEKINSEGGGDNKEPPSVGRGPTRIRSSYGDKKAPQAHWHDSLSDAVKAEMNTKSIRTSTGTIDIAVGPARIKLGTRGYCSMATADKILAEGTFACDKDGNLAFEWTHAIQFNEDWNELEDKSSLLKSLSLGSGKIDSC